MIRKMAEERAKLSEQGIYEEPVVRNLQPPLARGTSEAGN